MFSYPQPTVAISPDCPARSKLADGGATVKVLIVGGAGRVATWTIPYMRDRHQIRVLDVRTPRVDGVEFVEGSITDPEALKRALDGVDTFVNMVMKNPTDPHSNSATVEDITSNYAVNTLGLHLLLYTAQSMGVARGVHTSTFTVHARDRSRYAAEANSGVRRACELGSRSGQRGADGGRAV